MMWHEQLEWRERGYEGDVGFCEFAIVCGLVDSSAFLLYIYIYIYIYYIYIYIYISRLRQCAWQQGERENVAYTHIRCCKICSHQRLNQAISSHSDSVTTTFSLPFFSFFSNLNHSLCNTSFLSITLYSFYFIITCITKIH